MKHLTKQEALIKAQLLCSKKEYCQSEIRQKLLQWKVNSDYFDFILESLKNDKFIDENRYVEFFVRDKFKLNKWGKIKIQYALKLKQINQELIQTNLDKINEEDYKNACKSLIMNKLKVLENKEETEIKLKEKTLKFMQSRGFEYDLAKNIYASITQK